MAETTYGYPSFSLAERERRWAAVRTAMAHADIYCVITPHNTGHATHFQAESRYLTQCGGGDAEVACVFPFEGEVAAIASGCERWRAVQNWVADVREARHAYGQATVEKLREVALPRRRVGVVGLTGSIRAPEGTVLYGFMRTLVEAFPDVEWIDFTEELQTIRAVKSGEEIAFLTHSTELVDRAFQRIADVTRPGAIDYEVWAIAIGEITKGGSELPVRSRWGSGIRPTLLTRPTHNTVQRGHLIVNELEAAYGGYRVRGMQPIVIEDCDPVYRDLYAMHTDYWERCFEELQVGRSVGEIAERCRAAVADLLPADSRYKDLAGTLVIQGCGLGSDAPRLTSNSHDEAAKTQILAPGWSFVLKPTLRIQAANRTYEATWADTIVMTDHGPTRLGTRQPGLTFTGGS